MDDIVGVINQYGFPVFASVGLGYFVFFIWQWVTQTIDPIIGQTMGTIIALVDRVRMLDDMIRLNMKLSMLLEQYEKEGKPIDGNIEEILKRYRSRHEDVKDNRSFTNDSSDT